MSIRYNVGIKMILHASYIDFKNGNFCSMKRSFAIVYLQMCCKFYFRLQPVRLLTAPCSFVNTAPQSVQDYQAFALKASMKELHP